MALAGSVSASTPVRGTGRELNRALTNLIGNAIRHTPAGGEVDVRVGVTDESPQLVEVLVRDECGGIPEEHLDRIFEVGFRGEAARTPSDGRHPAGAGLGLAIARGIVEAHAGSVDVANRTGGCEFRVLLPVST